MTNALQALLGSKPAMEITDTVAIKRLGEDFTIKALTGNDLDKIRDQATQIVKNGKKSELKVNEEEVARLIIAKSVIDPNFADASLLDHFGAADAGECVQKALLFGEIVSLQEAIMALSGFDDEEEIEEVKN